MRIDQLASATTDVIRLRDEYHSPPVGELAFEFAHYAYLQGCFGKMSRQFPIRIRNRPHRIDLRYGGTNPVVVELALRPPQGGGQLYGSQNRTELRKLTRVRQTRARRRVLLLADLSHHPIGQGKLRATYDPINAGRGRFGRYPVRVVYARDDGWFSFLWRPHSQ